MEELLSPKEIATLLKVSVPTIYSWAQRGIIPCYKLGMCVRFSRDDLLEFLRKSRKDSQILDRGRGDP
jgi:excisionase family DNA binding protein